MGALGRSGSTGAEPGACGRPAPARSASIAGASLEGNDSSRRVSEKLGYRVVGMEERSPRGVPAPTTAVELARADWRCPVEVELEGVEPCLELFGAAPASRDNPL